jgi:hypothetical protein
MYYHDVMVKEWVRRGYNNSMQLFGVKRKGLVMPWWWGDPRFHRSHRNRLMQKDQEFYSQYGWKLDPSVGYWWPVTKENGLAKP